MISEMLFYNILASIAIITLISVIIKERSVYRYRKRLKQFEVELKSEIYQKTKEFNSEQEWHRYIKDKFRVYRKLVEDDN